MTQTKALLYSITVIAIAAIMIAISFQSPGVEASAPSGLQTSVATTSVNGVTQTQSRVFATSTCNSRIVTTGATAVMIGFSDVQGFLPTNSSGHLQLASTTVAYDSGVYGCDAWRVASQGNSTITVSETR